jgi:hypothetical protein
MLFIQLERRGVTGALGAAFTESLMVCQVSQTYILPKSGVCLSNKGDTSFDSRKRVCKKIVDFTHVFLADYANKQSFSLRG